jgi:hypothetical protein
VVLIRTLQGSAMWQQDAYRMIQRGGALEGRRKGAGAGRGRDGRDQPKTF